MKTLDEKSQTEEGRNELNFWSGFIMALCIGFGLGMAAANWIF